MKKYTRLFNVMGLVLIILLVLILTVPHKTFNITDPSDPYFYWGWIAIIAMSASTILFVVFEFGFKKVWGYYDELFRNALEGFLFQYCSMPVGPEHIAELVDNFCKNKVLPDDIESYRSKRLGYLVEIEQSIRELITSGSDKAIETLKIIHQWPSYRPFVDSNLNELAQVIANQYLEVILQFKEEKYHKYWIDFLNKDLERGDVYNPAKLDMIAGIVGASNIKKANLINASVN